MDRGGGRQKSTPVTPAQLVCETRCEITRRDKAEGRRLQHPLCCSAVCCVGSRCSAKEGRKVLLDPTKSPSALTRVETLRVRFMMCRTEQVVPQECGW